MSTRYLVKLTTQSGVSRRARSVADWHSVQGAVSDEDYGTSFVWPSSSLPQTFTDSAWAATGTPIHQAAAPACEHACSYVAFPGGLPPNIGGGGFSFYPVVRADVAPAIQAMNVFGSLFGFQGAPNWWRWEFRLAQFGFEADGYVARPGGHEPAPAIIVATVDTATSGIREAIDGQVIYPNVDGNNLRSYWPLPIGAQTVTVVYSTKSDATVQTAATTATNAFNAVDSAVTSWLSGSYAGWGGFTQNVNSLAYYNANVAPAYSAYKTAAVNYAVLATKAALTYLDSVLP